MSSLERNKERYATDAKFRARVLKASREWAERHPNYWKRYRKKHPEKFKQANERWRKSHPQYFHDYWIKTRGIKETPEPETLLKE